MIRDLLPPREDWPTLAECDRDEWDAANLPPERPLTRNGHRVVGFLRWEPVDHLAFDGVTTMCGQPYGTTVVRSSRPVCGDCDAAVER